MTTTARLAATAATPRNWKAQAACRNADPELFWPEKDTPPARIQQAKQICAGCPAKEFCLNEAYRINEWDAICGGLTGEERQQLLAPVTNRWAARRADNADARKLAVQCGAELLIRLVKHRASVETVAEHFSSTPRALYGAFRILVPAPVEDGIRTHAPSAIEKLLANSKESLRTLERMGRSHTEIAVVLGTSQSIVSASLTVLQQREKAFPALSAKGPQVAVERCWAEETRIRQQSGSGLTVEDVIEMAGTQILALYGSGLTLRQVAKRIGINRESVRLAYLRLTDKSGMKSLTQNEMEEAA